MPITAESEWLRTSVKTTEIGVDRENKRILGMVVAQEGVFKDRRGEFDQKGLKQIVTLGRKKKGGLKSRFAHPSLSGDGIGSFLGRVKNVRLDTVTVEREEGIVPLMAVRGDLHFADSAFDTPSGNLAGYVMDLAEEDSDALSSSLVLKPERVEKLDEKGNPLLDENGEPAPPLWYPMEIHASDLVDTGDAVDGLLSAGIDVDELRDGPVRKAAEMLENFLPDASRDVVEARLTAFLGRLLDERFGVDDEPIRASLTTDDAVRRMRAKGIR